MRLISALRPSFLLTAALASAVAAMPTPVRACEPGSCVEGLTGPAGAPLYADGALWVAWNLAGADAPVYELFDESGAAVPFVEEVEPGGALTVAWGLMSVLRPQVELAPGSRLTLRVGPERDVCGGFEAEVEVTADPAPELVWDERIEWSVGPDQDSEDTSNCLIGPPRWELRVSPVQRPLEAVAWRLYADGALAATGPRSVAFDILREGETEPEPTEYQLRAVDAAGRERAGESFWWPEPDTGDDDDDDDDDDAGDDDDDSASQDEDPVAGCGGCQQSGAGPRSGLLGLTGLALLLWGRRRGW